MLAKKVIALLTTVFLILVVGFEHGAQSIGQPEFLDWKAWYPLDRGQEPGERVWNWWVRENSDTPNQYYFGQSTWNIRGVPNGFPAVYNAQPVDYFVKWICDSRGDDPECESWKLYREFMSQGTAYADATYLEHWGRGTPTNWEVYYASDAFESCESEGITAVSDAYLQRPENKEPFVMRLSAAVGGKYFSPVICAISFQSYAIRSDQIKHEQIGLWFVVNLTLERFVDAKGDQIILAENQYYMDNLQQSAAFKSWCQATQKPNYCVEEAGDWSGLTRTHEGVTGHLHAFEQYWMREVPPENRLLNGFGAFHW